MRVIPHIEMALSTTSLSTTLASQDAAQQLSGTREEELLGVVDESAAIPPQSMHGHEAAAVMTELATAHEADGRLLHMIKGLAGSALDASEVVQQQLDGQMTSSAQRRAQRLASSTTSALKETIEYLVSRQVFSDLERGQYLTRKLDGDLTETLHSALRDGEGIVEVRSASGDLVAGGSQRLMFDAVILRMVLNEALSNCRKYRAPETPILLSASFTPEPRHHHRERSAGKGRLAEGAPSAVSLVASDGILRVVIENRNATGVPRLTDDECLHVFERGVRGPNATATSTGIGLDTVRKATTAGGGSAALSTRADADGNEYTRLMIELPAEQSQTAHLLARGGRTTRHRPPSLGAASDGPGGSSYPPADVDVERGESSSDDATAMLPDGLMILVADDLRTNRLILGYHLASICRGSTIMEASSGAEILGIVERQSTPERPLGFDLFFLDDQMEDDISGSEVISRLKRTHAACDGRDASALFVMVTASGRDEANRLRLKAAGADLVWDKPLPHELEMASSLKAALVALQPSRWGDSSTSGSVDTPDVVPIKL